VFFNSIQFGVFFTLVWAGVLVLAAPQVRSALGNRVGLRNCFLLVASYTFYGFWDWRFLSLIAISTLVDFYCGKRMAQLEATEENRTVRKNLLLASLVTNLGFLGFFKYCDFFIESAAASLELFGLSPNLTTLGIVLPVGISFYTFQTLSYTIDVYRGRMKAETSLLNFATYVAFFPQLVAGPIERARDLLPQFREPTRLKAEQLHSGFFLICWGLFKKVVVADNVAGIADAAFALEDPNGWQALLGAYAFAVQIYCDFSGYTDIARGAARCLGFELSLNFNIPYVAQNPSDFWRRWHISLSSWLRDYLYIPLGGNRKGARRTYINLMLTMLLGGLWHGAAWTFVLWGAYHGLLLAAYRLFTPWVLERLRIPDGAPGFILRLLNGLFFFQLVCISWILFRATSVKQAINFMTAAVSDFGDSLSQSVSDFEGLGLAIFVSGILMVVQAAQHLTRDHLFILRLPAPARSLIYAVGALLFLYIGEFGGEAFIYFQF
jgi:alginate O-acetyltransferase complex protein AlgI